MTLTVEQASEPCRKRIQLGRLVVVPELGQELLHRLRLRETLVAKGKVEGRQREPARAQGKLQRIVLDNSLHAKHGGNELVLCRNEMGSWGEEDGPASSMETLITILTPERIPGGAEAEASGLSVEMHIFGNAKSVWPLIANLLRKEALVWRQSLNSGDLMFSIPTTNDDATSDSTGRSHGIYLLTRSILEPNLD